MSSLVVSIITGELLAMFGIIIALIDRRRQYLRALRGLVAIFGAMWAIPVIVTLGSDPAYPGQQTPGSPNWVLFATVVILHAFVGMRTQSAIDSYGKAPVSR